MANNILCFTILLFCLGNLLLTSLACDNSTELKGLFIFGGSEVDIGNNNDAHCKLRANFPPYGVDFAAGATGRMSNGKLVSDCIADQLKLPYPTAFVSSGDKGVKLAQGVNFGSAGSGLIKSTGVLLFVTTIQKQVSNFLNVIVPKFEKETGCPAPKVLSQYLFLIGAGEDDYKSYYSMKQYKLIPPSHYVDMLLDNYHDVLLKLYKKGARKFLLVSVAPIGCSPFISKEQPNCVEDLNTYIDMFTKKLEASVNYWKQDMEDAEFTIIDSSKIIQDLIKNPSESGFENVNCACCETSQNGICKMDAKTCSDRTKYVFFDGVRPTEKVNCIVASKGYSSTKTSEVFPMSIKKLTHV